MADDDGVAYRQALRDVFDSRCKRDRGKYRIDHEGRSFTDRRRRSLFRTWMRALNKHGTNRASKAA